MCFKHVLNYTDLITLLCVRHMIEKSCCGFTHHCVSVKQINLCILINVSVHAVVSSDTPAG